MQPKYQNILFSASLLVLPLLVAVSVNAQDTKQKKEIRITISQDGKVKTDTSFETDNDIQKEDLDALIDEFQHNPGSFQPDFSHWQHNGETFSFPFDHKPDIEISGDLDSLFRNMYDQYGFSMNFDNDSVFEKQFWLGNNDSTFTYTWKGKPGKTWRYQWQDKPCPCPKDSAKGLENGSPRDVENGPVEEEIILDMFDSPDEQGTETGGETTGETDTRSYRTISL